MVTLATEVTEQQIKQAVARELLAARGARGDSQWHVAKCIGISQATLHNYEQGKQLVRIDIAARLARFYGLSWERLTGQRLP